MNWKRIPKENSQQPSSGTYKDWKSLLALEGFHQCVYCSISECDFGGIRNFHVEHYRPKSTSRFPHLENTYSNLFYACSICNSFKSDDWPNEPNVQMDISCYLEPSQINYSDIFDIKFPSGLIEGKNVAAKYMSHKLYLNRPQLLVNRRENFVASRYEKAIGNANRQVDRLIGLAMSGNMESVAHLASLNRVMKELEAIFHSKCLSIPYTDKQTKREA